MINAAAAGLIGGTLVYQPIVYTVATTTTQTTWVPSDVFASWSEDGTTISVPIASFNGLTAATADGVTGDARQLALSFCSSVFEWYNELTTLPEAMAAEYKPGRVQTTGSFAGNIQSKYTFTFETLYPEGTVADEPS